MPADARSLISSGADGGLADGTSAVDVVEAVDAAAPVVATADASLAEVGSSDDAASDEDSKLSKRERRKRRKEAAAAAARADAPNADAGGSPVAPAKDPGRGNAPLPPSDGSASPAAGEPGKEASAADCALPDKDLARESWRRNWPAVCPIAGAGKAFILIPIKGPLEGETHALHRRPTREARINLAAGTESLLTMKQYKMNRLGFKELRVSTSEDGRSRLRVKLLPNAGDPVFEIKDGYAKITVAVPD